MREGAWRKWVQKLDPWLIALVIVMLINVAALGRSPRSLVRPVGELSTIRAGAMALGDFYSNQAKDLGLEHNAAVRDALAKYRFEVEQASTLEAVAKAMGDYGLNISNIFHRELQLKREQVVLGIISRDPGLAAAPEGATVVVRSTDEGVRVDDPAHILSIATIQRLQADPSVKQMTELAQIEMRGGKPRLLTTRSLPSQIQALRQEMETTRATLTEAMQAGGYAQLVGPGLVIRARQSAGQALLENVLGYDLRDIVNELFAAGAKGIQVGSQRLIATSSIRAVGDTVLVNHQTVPVDPLEIKAVGDPTVLASALDLITNTPYFGLMLDIQKRDSVTLVGHPLR
ncbi:MAG: DUF881 domain-containing protein [Firmicutes bacterium]|nr:DUF881 domain-containing protein [Bacillota bacterium]